MAREYIVLKREDAALWRLARAVARQNPGPPGQLMTFADLARRMCEKEGGAAEVNIAQMSEIVAVLQELLREDPEGVLGVLADKLEDA